MSVDEMLPDAVPCRQRPAGIWRLDQPSPVRLQLMTVPRRLLFPFVVLRTKDAPEEWMMICAGYYAV